MPPAQPWRDIPSAAAVQEGLRRLDIEDNLQRLGVLDGGKAAKQKTSLKTRLSTDVAHYHRVPKDRLSSLVPRETMLRGIAASANALWANAGGRATQMGPMIASLADNATQKANYLRKIYEFYKGEGAGLFRGQDLLNFLKSPPHASGGHLANLQRGCRLETIDPVHRSSEVHLPPPSTPFNLDSLNCGMNWAFAEWCGALMQAPGGDANDIIVRKNFTVNDIDAASLPPFFLWLENHRICVGSDTDKFGTFYYSPGEVTGVLFSPYGQASRAGGGAIKAVQGIHWLVPSSDGVLVEMPLDDPKSGMRLFDTMHLPGKKGAEEEKQSAAYAWTQCGTLLVGEHATGEFHHSSFVAGDSVRCAGMIRVAGGKVDMISSNSGHYRPSEANLRQFASWLNDRRVFREGITTSAFARFHRGVAIVNEEIPVFLGLRAATAGRFGQANFVTPALDQLGQLVATAVTRYNASGTRVKAFSFMRGLTKSNESKEAVAYLQNDFPRDLEVAKLNTSEEKWWSVPVNVIQSLLGEPGSISFAKIQGDAQKLSPVIGRSNSRFSAGIGRLVPLKNPSTLHSILAEEWGKWRRPKPVGLPVSGVDRKN